MTYLFDTVSKVRRTINPSLKIKGIVLTLVDKRTNLDKEVRQEIEESYGQFIKIYDTEIPRAVKTAEATINSTDMLYAIGLVLVVIGIVIFIAALTAPKDTKNVPIIVLAEAALLAALCYVGAGYLKIDIPVGTEKTMFHLGNVFCVLAALLLGGMWGGLAGAVGMTLSDLMTGYVTSAPKTFLLKLCIGLIVGLVAHKVFKIAKEGFPAKRLPVAVVVSCIAGMAFNVVADPIVGYFYKTYLLGTPQELAKALAKINSITTLVNAIIAVIVASVVYLALRPALKKAGLFREI